MLLLANDGWSVRAKVGWVVAADAAPTNRAPTTIVTITSTWLVFLVGLGRPAERTGRDIGTSKAEIWDPIGQGTRSGAAPPPPDDASYLRKIS